MKNPKYIVQVNITKKLNIHVAAGSVEEAANKAEAALKEKLDKFLHPIKSIKHKR